MKLSSIIVSRTVRFLQGNSPSGGIFLPHLSAMMQNEFHFLQVPTKLEEYDSSKGIKFLHGIFEDTVLDIVEMYHNGIIVQTHSNTNVADKFIDQLINISSKALNYKVTNVPLLKKNYNSELEVIIESDVSKSFDRFNSVTKFISSKVSKYADNIPPFQTTGFIISCDHTASPHLKPMRFSLDRRNGQPFNTNVFYSTAPLSTDDHLEALTELEKAL